MRPFDDMSAEEEDYGDVALLVASVREWPEDEFVRELDARVQRRFAPASAPAARSSVRGRLPRWAAGPAVAVLAGAVAAVVVLSNGGPKPALDGLTSAHRSSSERPTVVRGSSSKTPTTSDAASSSAGASTFAPVAPGRKQIRSAQISLTTPNRHVEQVATEVFNVVSAERGSVQNSHVTSATGSSGGGYASFTLSFPTSNLQDAMAKLSSLHYAALISSADGSQNVSNQYNADRRQLADAKALRASLLGQLETADTDQQIDSIKAQLKLAEQQISSWQSTLNSLEHRISYSNVAVQINSAGLPVVGVAHSSSFTIGRAGHDALRVLVVSAGVALIALAIAIPVGLAVALLVWLWVWLRQRRREQALDTAS